MVFLFFLNFPIKREQNDACISYAEREESQAIA